MITWIKYIFCSKFVFESHHQLQSVAFRRRFFFSPLLYYIFLPTARAFGKIKRKGRFQKTTFFDILLFQEAETLDDGELLSLATTDLEEADDGQNKDDDSGNAVSDPTKEGDNAEDNRDDGNNLKLQGLLNVESHVLGVVNGEQGDDDADPAHQIGNHGQNLVLGDVGLVELGRVIGRIEVLIGAGVEGSAALVAEGNSVVTLVAAMRTGFHSQIPRTNSLLFILYTPFVHKSITFCKNPVIFSVLSSKHLVF